MNLKTINNLWYETLLECSKSSLHLNILFADDNITRVVDTPHGVLEIQLLQNSSCWISRKKQKSRQMWGWNQVLTVVVVVVGCAVIPIKWYFSKIREWSSRIWDYTRQAHLPQHPRVIIATIDAITSTHRKTTTIVRIFFLFSFSSNVIPFLYRETFK